MYRNLENKNEKVFRINCKSFPADRIDTYSLGSPAKLNQDVRMNSHETFTQPNF